MAEVPQSDIDPVGIAETLLAFFMEQRRDAVVQVEAGAWGWPLPRQRCCRPPTHAPPVIGMWS